MFLNLGLHTLYLDIFLYPSVYKGITLFNLSLWGFLNEFVVSYCPKH